MKLLLLAISLLAIAALWALWRASTVEPVGAWREGDDGIQPPDPYWSQVFGIPIHVPRASAMGGNADKAL